MAQAVVYGLIDPRTGVIRYIGATANPEGRSAYHRKSSPKNAKTAYFVWKRELMNAGLLPEFIVLSEWPTKESAYEEERRLIALYGVHPDGQLVNMASGGLGMSPELASVVFRCANAGRYQTEEYRASSRKGGLRGGRTRAATLGDEVRKRLSDDPDSAPLRNSESLAKMKMTKALPRRCAIPECPFIGDAYRMVWHRRKTGHTEWELLA